MRSGSFCLHADRRGSGPASREHSSPGLVTKEGKTQIDVSVAGSMTKKPFEAGAEESALIERAKGDQEAFGLLYERYS